MSVDPETRFYTEVSLVVYSLRYFQGTSAIQGTPSCTAGITFASAVMYANGRKVHRREGREIIVHVLVLALPLTVAQRPTQTLPRYPHPTTAHREELDWRVDMQLDVAKSGRRS